MKNYYNILEVIRTASPEVIAAAYRALAKKYHPDLCKTPDANSRMQEINEAYTVLGNEIRREKYDRKFVFSENQKENSSYSDHQRKDYQQEEKDQEKPSQKQQWRSYVNPDFSGEDLCQPESLFRDFTQTLIFEAISGLYNCSSETTQTYFKFYSDGLFLVKTKLFEPGKADVIPKINRLQGTSYDSSGSYFHMNNLIEFTTYSDQGIEFYQGKIFNDEIHLLKRILNKGLQERLVLKKIK